MSDSLRPHGLYRPWNSPGQNTGVGSLSLLQGIFPTQVPHTAGGFLTSWTTSEAQLRGKELLKRKDGAMIDSGHMYRCFWDSWQTSVYWTVWYLKQCIIHQHKKKTIKKWAGRLNRRFSREDLEMANMHIKRCSTSLTLKQLYTLQGKIPCDWMFNVCRETGTQDVEATVILW